MQDIQSLIKDITKKSLLTVVLHSHVELSIKDYLSTEIRVTSYPSDAEHDINFSPSQWGAWSSSLERLDPANALQCMGRQADTYLLVIMSCEN